MQGPVRQAKILAREILMTKLSDVVGVTDLGDLGSCGAELPNKISIATRDFISPSLHLHQLICFTVGLILPLFLMKQSLADIEYSHQSVCWRTILSRFVLTEIKVATVEVDLYGMRLLDEQILCPFLLVKIRMLTGRLSIQRF